MRRLAALTIVTMALAGCAHYEAMPADPASNAEAFDARRLDAPPLLEFLDRMAPETAAGARAGQWSKTALGLAALYEHPDLEIARGKLAEAEASGLTARELANPSITVSPTKHTSLADPPWTVGLAADLLIELPNKRAARRDEADRLADAARDDLLVASWQIRGGVATAATQLLGARDRHDILRRRLALAREAASLAAARLAEGGASSGDAARAEAAAADARMAEAAGAQAEAEAESALAAAVGVPLRAVDGIRLADEPAGEPADAVSLRRAALVGRSDVKAALAELQAADAALRLQIARQYPDLRLGPSYAYEEGDNLTAIGLTVDLPVLNQNQGPIAEATARRRVAAARLVALQAHVANDIDAALRRSGEARQALAMADEEREEAAHALERAERAFAEGAIDRPALVAAELAASEADLDRADALAGRRAAADALEAALQVPQGEAESVLATVAPSPGAGS